jgi:hypothetical protein
LEESSLFIEKMSCKTEYAYCSLRDRQSELTIFVSAIVYRPISPLLGDGHGSDVPNGTSRDSAAKVIARYKQQTQWESTRWNPRLS